MHKISKIFLFRFQAIEKYFFASATVNELSESTAKVGVLNGMSIYDNVRMVTNE